MLVWHAMTISPRSGHAFPGAVVLRSDAAFALIESIIGMGLVSLILSCVFAMNAHLLGLLKQGKESTYATELIQERVDQLRTSLWDEVTDPARLANVIAPVTETATNLPGVTETITIEPVVNATNISARCVRTPGTSGTVTSSGTVLTAQQSVRATIFVQWTSRGRARSRGTVTILTKGGI